MTKSERLIIKQAASAPEVIGTAAGKIKNKAEEAYGKAKKIGGKIVAGIGKNIKEGVDAFKKEDASNEPSKNPGADATSTSPPPPPAIRPKGPMQSAPPGKRKTKLFRPPANREYPPALKKLGSDNSPWFDNLDTPEAKQIWLEKKAGWGWDLLHGALDIAGAIPIVGNVADLANAGIYAARGKAGDAALSLAAAVPVVGYGATAAKGAKWTHKGYKAVKGTSKTAPKVLKAQTKANKVPAGTRIAQGSAENVSKLPLSVQKGIKATNQATHNIGKKLGKVPVLGSPVRPGGKINKAVKGLARFRGFDNTVQGLAGAGFPGMATVDNINKEVTNRATDLLLAPIDAVTGYEDPLIQQNKDLENKNKELMKMYEEIQNQNQKDNTRVDTSLTVPGPMQNTTKTTDELYKKQYQRINEILGNQ